MACREQTHTCSVSPDGDLDEVTPVCKCEARQTGALWQCSSSQVQMATALQQAIPLVSPCSPPPFFTDLAWSFGFFASTAGGLLG